jgi:hypothetical protein
VTVTALASVAVTVNIVFPPAAMVVGLAAMFTVGVTVDVLLTPVTPHPKRIENVKSRQIDANGLAIQQ